MYTEQNYAKYRRFMFLWPCIVSKAWGKKTNKIQQYRWFIVNSGCWLLTLSQHALYRCVPQTSPQELKVAARCRQKSGYPWCTTLKSSATLSHVPTKKRVSLDVPATAATDRTLTVATPSKYGHQLRWGKTGPDVEV